MIRNNRKQSETIGNNDERTADGKKETEKATQKDTTISN
jgi:hypothetical protein